MFYHKKTRFTFSGDYTLIVSKAYFISLNISKSTIQLIIHNLNKLNKTKYRKDNFTLGKHTPQKGKKKK